MGNAWFRLACVLAVLLLAPSLTAQPEAPAAIEVATTTIAAEVQSVNVDNRTVEIVGADGILREFVIETDEFDLRQIVPGDTVRITATESYVVFVGETVDVSVPQTVALIPETTDPDVPPQVVWVQSWLIDAQVESVDVLMSTITLSEVGGEPRTITVGANVDLEDVVPGDAVTIRVTEATALVLEKM